MYLLILGRTLKLTTVHVPNRILKKNRNVQVPFYLWLVLLFLKVYCKNVHIIHVHIRVQQ